MYVTRSRVLLVLLALVLSGLWLAAWTAAQETGPPDEAGQTTQSGEPPGGAAGVAEGPQPEQAEQEARGEQPAAERAPGITFNFRGASLDSVIEAIVDATGLNVIKATEVGGTVTIVNRQPLTVDEALNVLNEVLRVRGATLVRSQNFITILPLGEARLYARTVRRDLGGGPGLR